MRVAVFYFLKFGGAKRVVMDQVKGMEEANINVDCYTINNDKDFFDPSPFASNFKNFNFEMRFEKIPIFGQISKLYYVLVNLRRLQKKIAYEIDNQNYEAVIVHPDIYTQAPFLLRYLKTPTIYYSQEPYRLAYEHLMRIDENYPFYVKIFEHIKRFLIKINDRKNVKSAKHILTSSLSVRERMIQAYDVYAKVIPPGINTKVFKKMGYKKSKVLLFVGNKNEKLDGHDLLLSALSFFPKSKKPKVKYVVWKKNNSERISEKELAKIYETSYVTMCMSRFETFGLIPLESMACGTPVIATNIGGHRETIVDKLTGYLVEPDPYEIYEKIVKILHMEKYNTMSNAGQRHVSRFWSSKKVNFMLVNYIKKICRE